MTQLFECIAEYLVRSHACQTPVMRDACCKEVCARRGVSDLRQEWVAECVEGISIGAGLASWSSVRNESKLV